MIVLLALLGVPPDEADIYLARIEEEISAQIGDAVTGGFAKGIPYIGAVISVGSIFKDVKEAVDDAKIQAFMTALIYAMGLNGGDMQNLTLIVQHFEEDGTPYVSLLFQTADGTIIDVGTMTYMQFRPIYGALWDSAEAHWKSPRF